MMETAVGSEHATERELQLLSSSLRIAVIGNVDSGVFKFLRSEERRLLGCDIV